MVASCTCSAQELKRVFRDAASKLSVRDALSNMIGEKIGSVVASKLLADFL